MNFDRRQFLALAGAQCGGFGALGCASQPDDEVVTIGAMPPGTSWYVFAATLAKLLQPSLPEGTRIEVVARGGAIGNPILVDRREETIAISQAATAAWAYSGNPVAYGQPHTNLRALAGGLNRVWMAALMTEEYIGRTGNDTLKKALQSGGPLRVVMKPQGSSVPVVADILFKSLGTSREKIVEEGGQIIQVAANQISAMLRNGRADLYFETAIRGHPTLTEVATTTSMRFVDFPEETLTLLAGPGIDRIPMPMWFRGQSGPMDFVDMGTVLITHKDLPKELAHLITQTVCENKGSMAEAHGAWEDFNPTQAGQPGKTGIPLHSGAEEYYSLRGWT